MIDFILPGSIPGGKYCILLKRCIFQVAGPCPLPSMTEGAQNAIGGRAQ